MKVALVHNMLPPYRVPLFERLGRDPRFELHILFMAVTEGNRRWAAPSRLDVPHEFLPGWHPTWHGGEATAHFNPSVVGAIRRLRPDAVVLGGYDSATCFLAAATPGVRRRVLWSETNDEGKPAHEGFRAVPKRWLIGRVSDALVPGRRAEAYLRRFARPALRCHVFPNVVDETLFRIDAARREALRGPARETLGVRGTTFLFSGRMIERKGFDLLVDAFVAARIEGPATLLAVGEGPLESNAREAEHRLGPGKTIRIVPFRQPQELPSCYAAADVLVLPSRQDPWPLVTVEAMMSGLPVVVSSAVGNAPDLVEPAGGGLIFPTGRSAELRGALERIAREDLAAAGARAAAHAIAYCSLDRCAESFAAAVGAA